MYLEGFCTLTVWLVAVVFIFVAGPESFTLTGWSVFLTDRGTEYMRLALGDRDFDLPSCLEVLSLPEMWLLK